MKGKKIRLLKLEREEWIKTKFPEAPGPFAREKKVWCCNGFHHEEELVVRSIPEPIMGLYPIATCLTDTGIMLSERKICDCDGTENPLLEADSKDIPLTVISKKVLQAFSLVKKVESDEIFIALPQSAEEGMTPWACGPRTWLTEEDLQHGHFLKIDQSVVISHQAQTKGGKLIPAKTRFTNKNGKLIRTDALKEEKRAFAALSLKQLQEEYGLEKKEALSIIRAAGPGAGVKAAEYGALLVRTAPISRKAILTMLNQRDPKQSGLGRQRTEDAFKSLKLPIPEGTLSSTAFFQILRGAYEFVFLWILSRESRINK